jgi:hypothetical protein
VVVIAWVFFRSADFAAAGRMLEAMFGGQGISSISSYDAGTAFAWLGTLLAAVWLLPNTQEILADYAPALEYEAQRAGGGGNAMSENTLPSWARWRPASPWAIAVSIVAVFTVTQMSRISEFIYWQF